MSDFLTRLDSSVTQIKSGTPFGSGTQRTAAALVQTLRGLGPAEALDRLNGALDHAEGEYRTWLAVAIKLAEASS